MVHRYLLGLVVLAVFMLVLTVAHQLLVDSPLFELGAEHWFPGAPDGLALWAALRRLAVSGALPTGATLVAALLVLTAPFRMWLWAVVAVVALTDIVSPLLQASQLSCRPPTDGEAAKLARVPTDGNGVRLCIVDDAREGPINGFAVGGPFTDTIGVSRYALERLDGCQLAALVAHELGHHRLHHAVVRAGASVAWLILGAAILTALFSQLSTASLAGLVMLVAVERLVATVTIRATEYSADAFAARQTSTVPSVELLVLHLFD